MRWFDQGSVQAQIERICEEQANRNPSLTRGRFGAISMIIHYWFGSEWYKEKVNESPCSVGSVPGVFFCTFNVEAKGSIQSLLHRLSYPLYAY